MSTYLITPPDETSWRIEPSDLVARIRRQWPDAQIDDIANPDALHAFEWVLHIDGLRLDGSIDRAGQAVSLDGDVRACARFARWYRTQVPSGQPLLFYDQGYSADIALNDDTREDDIAAAFVA